MHTTPIRPLLPALAFLLLQVREGILDTVKCPRYCYCYINITDNMRSVSCIGKRLDSIDLSIPRKVQTLDLSNNSISLLEDRGFLNLGLTDVVKVVVKYNSIRTVGLHSFTGLIYLEWVDLSSNNLYKILPWTFHDNSNLKFISLSNNPLGHIVQSGPFMDVPSLEILKLRSCSFAHFPDEAFSALPNLRQLDISNNQIISFDVYTLQFLYNLEELDVSKNPWQCNANLKNLKDFLDNKLSRLVGSSCDGSNEEDSTQPEPVKFERMISVGEAYPDCEDSSANDSSEQSEEYMLKRTICDCQCPGNAQEDNIARKQPLPPIWLMLVGFQLGVCFTVVIGYIYVYCSNKNRKYQSLEQTCVGTGERQVGPQQAPRVTSDEQVLPCPDTPPPAYTDLFS